MIGIIGDLHFKDKLGYDEYSTNGRDEEKKEVLDFIVENFEDCDEVVMLGDQFNSKHNASNVIKEFTNFLERFEKKKVYIICGNHEKTANGKTAIDYLQEIKGKKWNIVTREIFSINNMVFCPYFSKAELGVETNEEATEILMNKLLIESSKISGPKFLFVHHAVSGTSANGISTDLFNEIVLDKKRLEEVYDMVVGGHIHKPQLSGRTIISGSVFTNEVNEEKKYVWKVGFGKVKVSKVQQIELPVTPIIKIENPTKESLLAFEKKSILKVIITDREFKIDEITPILKSFNGYVIIEQYPNKRKKIGAGEDIDVLDLNINSLIGIYAKERGISIDILNRGLELIN